MGSKNMIQWSKNITPSLVSQLIRAEKNVQKAILIFDSATAEYVNGFRHDHNTFRVMLSRLVSANQFRLAEELLDRMKKEKCDITEDIFLLICRAYGRVHKPLDTVRIFHLMKEFQCEPSPKTYVTVFSILVDENQLKLALRFYKYMKQMSVPPSLVSINVLIKALCKNSGTIDNALKIFREMPKHGCTPDSFTYGTLINGLCRLGKITEAKELFKEMDSNDCSPSVITYTSLMHGLCRSSNLDEAVSLFEEMVCKGVNPNVFTYSSLIDGLCKGGRSSQALEMLHHMVSKRQTPNTITYSSLINGLCKEKMLQKAVELLDRMKLQGLKPDAGLYQKVISGLCDDSKFQEAANFLDEMIIGGISPNRITWCLHVRINNMVVQGLSGQNDLNRAFLLYLSMRTRGISVDAKTFDVLVSCFCKKGDLHKAARIFDEMVIDGCIPDEETWRTVVFEFWNRRKVREAAELVLSEVHTSAMTQ